MNNVYGQVKGVLSCVKRSAFVVILPSKTCFWIIDIIVQKHRPNSTHNVSLKSEGYDNNKKNWKTRL